MPLEAVIFDVDGTLADTERHGHRVAFNLAFERLGMTDRWDEELYGKLLRVHGGKERLDHYLAQQGMPLERRSRLAAELHRIKHEYFLELIRQGRAPLRSGVARLLDELEAAGIRTAIATTGSRAWVADLLDVLLGAQRRARFEVLVTGEDVTQAKPDPQAYRVALERLGLQPAQALAIEDSEPGLRSAKGAGLACVVVRNAYTAGGDFSLADLVVDDLGEPETAAPVVLDPHGVGLPGCVTAETLARVLDAVRRTG